MKLIFKSVLICVFVFTNFINVYAVETPNQNVVREFNNVVASENTKNLKIGQMTDNSGTLIESFVLLSTVTLERTEFMGAAVVSSALNYDLRTFEGTSTVRINGFSHKINSFESLFGSPIKLESYAEQSGFGYSSMGNRLSYSVSTSGKISTTSSFFTKVSKSTNFTNYYENVSGVGYNSGIRVTLLWKNKNGTTSSFQFNNNIGG